MTEYSRMAKGSFTAVGTAADPASQVVNLPFKPDFVEVWNYTNIKTPAATTVTRAWWDSSFIDPADNTNPTFVEGYGADVGGIPGVSFNRIASNGISAFSAGQLLQFGPTQQIVTSTKGATTSFQVTGHGYVVGDVVLFEGLYNVAGTGMPQMAGIPFTVTVVTDANNFVVAWNSSGSNYTNIAGSPVSAKVKKILYPYLYEPGTSFISSITLGATTTVTTTAGHQLRAGQLVAFRIPQQWGTVELNSLPNTLVPGSPVYGYVTTVNSYRSVDININSSAMTAFNVNQTVASVRGLSFPQIVAVGDVNTGGQAFGPGTALYPPPIIQPFTSQQYNTINGPAIRGAYFNNTSQGFVIGMGAADAPVTGSIMITGDLIVWRAFLHDMSLPS